MEEDKPTPVPIIATPKLDQLVSHDGKTFKTVQEGKAYILVPPNARTSLDPNARANGDANSQAQNVFYNPIQQFNRDLSVLAIKAFGEDLCRRKTIRHAAQKSRQSEKRERKRKRGDVAAIGDEDGEEREGGVKIPKAEMSGTLLGMKDGGGKVLVEDTNGVHVGEVPSNDEKRPAAQDADGVLATAKSTDTHETASEPVRAAAQTWRPQFRILDALSATGLRALRYASEISFATAIVANDRDRNAVKSIKLNVEHNKLADRITMSIGDAQAYMYSVAFPPTNSHGPNHISGKFDVIDLDPYGTAAPFIDAALQALDDGGLLCITCTDSGVFASCGYSEKTFSLYGGMPIKGLHSHEGGLRLILHSTATAAARYGMSIEPLLSLSIDFYVRVFVRVRKSAQEIKFLAGKTMLVYGCDHGCGAWTTQFLGRHAKLPGKAVQTNWKYTIAAAPSADRMCEHCGSKMHVAGPMWGGPLHNAAFVEKILGDLQDVDEGVYQTKARIEGMLDTALDELSVNHDTMDHVQASNGLSANESDNESRPLIPQAPPETLDHHPFFFIPSALCKVMHAQAPAENLIKGALRSAGYRVARSHCRGGSIKTDAPWSVIWHVFREWVRQRAPVKESALKEGSPGWRILKDMGETDGGVVNGNDNDGGDAIGGAGAEQDQAAKAVSNKAEEDPGTEPAAAEEVEGGVDCTKLPTKRLKVVFDEKFGRDKPGKRLVRYQQNPRENWGPMSRAKGHA